VAALARNGRFFLAKKNPIHVHLLCKMNSNIFFTGQTQPKPLYSSVHAAWPGLRGLRIQLYATATQGLKAGLEFRLRSLAQARTRMMSDSTAFSAMTNSPAALNGMLRSDWCSRPATAPFQKRLQ
jgi:hypothetical protein